MGLYTIVFMLGFVFFCGCESSSFYTSGETSSGVETLILNSDNTYEYKWDRFYGIGPIEDTIRHQGNWKRHGDTLLLNSSVLPSNYEDLDVEEMNENSDSLQIIICSNDSIPFFFISPSQLRINKTYYPVNPPTSDSIRIVLPKQESIGSIIIPGYPIYSPKNGETSIFKFTIKELHSTKNRFPSNTYFYNERMLLRGDTLFRLRNDTISNASPLFISKKN